MQRPPPQGCTGSSATVLSRRLASARARDILSVQHAQNLLAGGMSVAGGIGAGRLVFNGSDDAQDALLAGAINAKTVGPVQARQRLRLAWQP